MSVTSTTAQGSFYGTRVSADTTQYAVCGVSAGVGYAYAYCMARDVAGDYFYCSSTSPSILSAVRSLKEYSYVWLYRDPSSYDCVEIRVNNSSDYLPENDLNEPR